MGDSSLFVINFPARNRTTLAILSDTVIIFQLFMIVRDWWRELKESKDGKRVLQVFVFVREGGGFLHVPIK